MSITEIMDEAKNLSERERRELVAYLVHLEQDKESTYLERITRRIDEKEKFVNWKDGEEKGQSNTLDNPNCWIRGNPYVTSDLI